MLAGLGLEPPDSVFFGGIAAAGEGECVGKRARGYGWACRRQLETGLKAGDGGLKRLGAGIVRAEEEKADQRGARAGGGRARRRALLFIYGAGGGP